jgi:hypothetical protein
MKSEDEEHRVSARGCEKNLCRFFIRARPGRNSLVAAVVLLCCAACGESAAAWKLPQQPHPRGPGKAWMISSAPGGGDGDQSLRNAHEEWSRIAGLHQGVKCVRASPENEDLVGKWVPSSWKEGEDYIRDAPLARLAPGTLVAVDCADGYRRYGEVVGVSGLTYKVLENLSGKVQALSPSDVLLPTESGLAKCAVGRRRVAAANRGALELAPPPANTGTRAPTTTLERPAAIAALTPGKRARLPQLSVPETSGSSEANVTGAPAPATGPAVTRGKAKERRREGHSAEDKPSAKMDRISLRQARNRLGADWGL